ncbi:MAG: alpha/beta fold hydrolase [Candidatus Thorarchaeota archaeon]|nr:alpha/beta fold hydrolase [Candidatus Thorarchaeota archaeon]
MSLDVVGLRDNFTEKHRTFKTSDGITLFLREWEPKDADAKETAVLILHGITAHSGPYEFIGGPLSKLGFTTFGLDLRGHGLSDGNRGDTPGLERFTKDLCEAVTYLKSDYSKIVILGHSLGVFQSALIMNSCLQNIAGAVLLSGARTMRSGILPSPSFSQKIKIALSSITSPSKPVIEYRREGMTGLDDPLFTFNYTLRFLRMVDLKGMVFPENFDLPVFVGVGEEDELFTVDAVRELFDEIPSGDKKFYIQPGARHAVFPERSFQPLMDWMNERFT